jgi:hypothetical protein
MSFHPYGATHGPLTRQALDNIYIGPSSATRPTEASITAATTALNTNTTVWAINGALASACERQLLTFSSNSGIQALETNTLDIPATGAFIQFELNMADSSNACSMSHPTFGLDLQTVAGIGSNAGSFSSLQSGLVWTSLLPFPCVPTAAGCTGWTVPPLPGYFTSGAVYFTGAWSSGSNAILSSDYILDFWRQPNFARFTIPLNLSGSGPRRFRFISLRRTSVTAAWSLANVYIGTACGGNGCGGRGSCIAGACVCDSNAVPSGNTCVPAPSLATTLRETFDGPISTNVWSGIFSGALSLAYQLSNQRSMFFDGVASRRMETADLDCRGAAFVEFFFLMMGASPTVVSYSTNGGTSWTLMSALPHLTATGQYVLSIPPAARVPGVRFQWWQPNFLQTNDQFVSVCAVCRFGCAVCRWLPPLFFFFSIFKTPTILCFCLHEILVVFAVSSMSVGARRDLHWPLVFAVSHFAGVQSIQHRSGLEHFPHCDQRGGWPVLRPLGRALRLGAGAAAVGDEHCEPANGWHDPV